ncbi:MAG: hypothetical protein JRF30_01935 [Deltaproteobacteria bacterium]|nr:hypothetical protein [Deltaproteobacteria bacterium]MBW1793808.1 hypothetical protein [Deltaproteobacteria bacterium]MBW2329703.1 hypothetical protein [Deltaproteobacteria bacterium]
MIEFVGFIEFIEFVGLRGNKEDNHESMKEKTNDGNGIDAVEWRSGS